MSGKLKIIGLALMLAVFASACKSHKKISRVNKPLKVAAVDSVFKAMKDAEYQFRWLKGKFSGIYSVAGGKKQNFSGQFRMRKDSIIWCSITVMNIEVARVVVTPDSLKLLNRLAKVYFSSDIDYLNKKLHTDIDFDMLQALILGNDIPYYQTDKFKLETQKDYYVLNTVGRGKLKDYIKNADDLSKVLIQRMTISRDNHRIEKQNIRQLRSPNKKLIAEYSEFQNFDGLFPTKVRFTFIGTKEINVDFKFSKIEKDVPQKLPFKVPSRYKRKKGK